MCFANQVNYLFLGRLAECIRVRLLFNCNNRFLILAKWGWTCFLLFSIWLDRMRQVKSIILYFRMNLNSNFAFFVVIVLYNSTKGVFIIQLYFEKDTSCFIRPIFSSKIVTPFDFYVFWKELTNFVSTINDNIRN